MGDDHEEKLQAKYAKEWLELKHLLVGKHFSGEPLLMPAYHYMLVLKEYRTSEGFSCA